MLGSKTEPEWHIVGPLPVYRETAGWVHISMSHIRGTTHVGDGDEFFMSVPMRPSVLPESLWHEVDAASAGLMKNSLSTFEAGHPARGCLLA
jgi:hypothetical protein